MKHNIVAAVVLGVCLIAAAIIFSGRYYFIRVDSCSIARGDRWTGKVETVRAHGKDCHWWNGVE
jgi:hypothetical protein